MSGVFKRIGLTYSLMIGISLLITILSNQVVFNPTISLERGYYFTYPALMYKVGDIVLFCVNDARQVASMHSLGLPYTDDECNYHTPYLMKQIVAASGDWVQINESGVSVNGSLYSKSKVVFKHGRLQIKLPQYAKFKLKFGQYFVLGVSSHSYDSRYFGVVDVLQIYRKAFLLLPCQQSWW